ncbi:MAG: menaquinone biosynthesis protein [Thermodesulfobacteriaceae bacterium]|nr:menaquinone biosynthesis protein [Thermodesulfobacteriaceae bacterium]MDW8136599.1 menaquinone biosynthesis protein [Thermodesulfobacterium sp.]
MPKLKIGFPLYLNTLPLLFFLPQNSKIEIIVDIPKNLNFKLKKNLLQGGLVSSTHYAKNFEEYFLLPDISISAVGKVKSVILFHHLPLEKLQNQKIGITPETESSYALLRVLLEDFLKIHPAEYVELSHNLKELSWEKRKSLAAYLAIGDEALTLTQEHIFPYHTDLAELWLKYTNLPFVFALIAVRKEIVEKFRDELKFLCYELYQARAKAFSNLKEIVEKSHLKIDKEVAYNYLTHLEHDFSPLKQKAFLTFCNFLYNKKIIPKVPQLNFFNL